MTANEVYKILCRFIENDFHCLEKKVDRMFLSVMLMLGGLVANLVVLLLKKF